MVKDDRHRHRVLEIMIHLMVWMVVFFFPQMIFVREEGFFSTFSHSLPLLIWPVCLAVVFYANYLWLVPRLLVNRNFQRFAFLNVLLIVLIQAANGVWKYFYRLSAERSEITRWENEGMPDSLLFLYRLPHGIADSSLARGSSPSSMQHGSEGHALEIVPLCGRDGYGSRIPPAVGKRAFGHPVPPKADGLTALLVLVRDFFIYLLLVVLAVVLHMSFRFRKAEMARKQAELRHTETELQSLRNQVSPHFLLNTLNNIYALVAIDREQAQEAIINLSRLLSHMLYQNRDTCTTLEREIDFLHRYVDLMRLRISPAVKVEFVDNVRDCGTLPIAPLIYISLVENAFKHGTGGNEGHVGIRITGSLETGIIQADIRNSNHPKSPDDKSGHGVGLQLVRRRLELLYPGRFSWRHGVDREHNEYYSLLTIHTR